MLRLLQAVGLARARVVGAAHLLHQAPHLLHQAPHQPDAVPPAAVQLDEAGAVVADRQGGDVVLRRVAQLTRPAIRATPMLDGAQGEACIGKPYTAEAMVAALDIVAERMAHRPVTGTFPACIRLRHA